MIVKAILFDIDGTLVDSNDMHVLAWQEAFMRVGANFDRQTIHRQIGKGTDMLVPALLPDASDVLQQELGKAHGEVFKARFLGLVRPFPGAHDLLAHVRDSGRKIALASSASAAELEHYLGLLAARDLVDVTTSADDVVRTKPAPDIFATALEKLAPLTAAEVLAVGDTPYDVESAGKCGIKVIALRSGNFSDDVLLAAGAITLYDNVSALLEGYDNSLLGR